MSARGWRERLFGLCRVGAIGLFLLVFTPIALRALTVVSHSCGASNRYSQKVILESLSLRKSVPLILSALAALMLLYAVLSRFARIHLSAALTALWLAASLLWVFAVQIVQVTDCREVINFARRFAEGDYTPLSGHYLNVYTYQLRLCLPLELLIRLFPKLDVNLLSQCLNAALGTAAIGVMGALCETLAGDGRARFASYALYLTFLPLFFFCTFVYNVQSMLLLCSAAMLCFARYVRTGRLRFGVAYAVLIALGVANKLNAAVPFLALLICAALHAILRRDRRILACAALSAVLALALPWLIVRQYELRGGVRMQADASTVSRLTMGLQDDSLIAPGWFNSYTEQFFDPAIATLSREEGIAVAKADLRERLREMAANPADTARFFSDKCLTQWLEPSYEILWWGNRTPKEGRFNGLAYRVYRDESPLNALLLTYMTAHQRAAYLLALLGAAIALRRRGDASQLMLPATILGGFLYHMIFEAKAQYIFVYAFYMMPLAAQGLCAVAGALAALGRRLRG